MSKKVGGDTGDIRLDLALNRLTSDGYGTGWSVVDKRKTLIKFGRITSMTINVSQTIWENGVNNETYLTPSDGNLIDTLSSSSTLDVGQVVSVEGHYWGGANNTDLIFWAGTATTNGQNKVTLPRPLCRCNRMALPIGAAPTGDIWVYQDTTLSGGVPTDLTKTHCVIRGTLSQFQSYKAASTISYRDAFIITGLTLGVRRNQSGAVDFTFERRDASLSPTRNFLPPYGLLPANSVGTTTPQLNLDPPIVIPPNHDFRMTGIASANSIASNCTISGYLAVKPDPLAA